MSIFTFFEEKKIKVHKFRIIFEIMLIHGFIMFEVVLFNIGQMHPEVSKSVFRIEKFQWEGLQFDEIKMVPALERVGSSVDLACTKIRERCTRMRLIPPLYTISSQICRVKSIFCFNKYTLSIKNL